MHLYNLTLSRPSAITVRRDRSMDRDRSSRALKGLFAPFIRADRVSPTDGKLMTALLCQREGAAPAACSGGKAPWPASAMPGWSFCRCTFVYETQTILCCILGPAVRRCGQFLCAQGARDRGGTWAGAGASAAGRGWAGAGGAQHPGVWRHPLPHALQVGTWESRWIGGTFGSRLYPVARRHAAGDRRSRFHICCEQLAPVLASAAASTSPAGLYQPRCTLPAHRASAVAPHAIPLPCYLCCRHCTQRPLPAAWRAGSRAPTRTM